MQLMIEIAYSYDGITRCCCNRRTTFCAHSTKDDVFYYIYGLLHSEDYKKRYANNLNKELPRIPCVKEAGDFWAFSQAGRDLAELHINYESVSPYPVNFVSGELFMDSLEDQDYRVERMKFGKKTKSLIKQP